MFCATTVPKETVGRGQRKHVFTRSAFAKFVSPSRSLTDDQAKDTAQITSMRQTFSQYLKTLAPISCHVQSPVTAAPGSNTHRI